MNYKLFLVVLITIATSPSLGHGPGPGPLAGSSIGTVGAQNNDLKNGDGKQSTSLSAHPGQPVNLTSRVDQLEAEFHEKNEKINTKTSSKSQHNLKEIKKFSRKSDVRETKVEEEPDSVRLTRVEEEIERLNYKFSLLNSNDENKKTETDKIIKLLTKHQDQMEKLQHSKEEPNMRNEIDEMKGRLVRIETTIFNNHEEDLMILNHHRSRRAVSLSTPPPCNFRVNCAFDFKNKSHEEHISKPPTSCMDLQKNGHVLNGYYPIKNGESRMSLVFCNFLSLQNTGMETSVGNMVIQTKSVHFFVQRNTSFNLNEIITFEIERLNVGGAMNLTTGIFTVPVAGVYHFEFSGCKDYSSGYFAIHLQLNGNQISYSAAGKWGSSFNTELTIMSGIHVSLRLKIGDRINLFKEGPAALADLNGYPATHFTGSLLEEDLEFA